MKTRIVVLVVVGCCLVVAPAPARAQEIETPPIIGVPETIGAGGSWTVVELKNPVVVEPPWKAVSPDHPDLFGTLGEYDPDKKGGYLGSYGWVPVDATSCLLVGLALPKPSSPDFAGDFVDFVLTVEVPSSGWAEIGRVRVVNGDYVGTAWGYGEAEIPPVVVGWVQGRRVGVFAYSYRESAQSVFYVWKVTFTCQVPKAKMFLPLVPKRSAHFTSGEPF